MPFEEKDLDKDLLSREEVEDLLREMDKELATRPQPVRMRSKVELEKAFPNQDRSLRCPQCHSAMVLKDGKFGLFYGCLEWQRNRCRSTFHADGETGNPVKRSLTFPHKSHKTPTLPVTPKKAKVKTRFEMMKELWG